MIQRLTMRSLTSKMRFFELFVENKKPNKTRTIFAGNLPKRDWVDGPRDGSS